MTTESKELKALRAVLAAIDAAIDAGCIEYLDQWEEANRDWYEPLYQARKLLASKTKGSKS